MTSHDEALRALEKKWRETANMLRSGASSSKRGDEGDRRRREGLRMDLCADELAALLTTRQEVAPVAWGVRSVHAECGDLWMCDFGLATIWKEDADRYADWLNENNAVDGPFVVVGFHDYTTTGQTSEARDGGVICIGSDSVVSHTHPEYGRGLFFTEDAIIDAAQLSTNVDELVTAGRLYQEAMDGTPSLQQRVFAAKRFDKALAAMRQEATR